MTSATSTTSNNESASSSSTTTDSKMAVSSTTTLPIRLMSKIVPGFGRGSKELGIPTANLSRTDMQCTLEFDSLPCGIYWGFARVISSSSSLEEEEKEKGGDGNGQGVRVPSQVYKAAVSIGFNPHYGNAEKTIEPHLIAASNHPLRNASKCGETQFGDMYNQWIRLSVVGYLRPELPFEGLDKLVLAIKDDIAKTETLCDDDDDLQEGTTEDSITRMEQEWVASSLGV